MTDQDLSDFSNFAFDLDPDLDAMFTAASGGDADGVSLGVVDEDQAVRDYLAGLFDGPVDKAATMGEIETRLGLAPIVVILGPSCTDADSLGVVNRWARSHPHVGALLVTPELTTELLQRALRAGVRDVLSAPIVRDEVIATVDRIGESLASSAPVPAAPASPRAATDPSELGRVLAVFSTKGGSGKSVTATNVGVVMAQHTDRPVVLIDGHLQFGDVAVMLKLQPEHTVVDAIDHLEHGDAAVIRDLLTEHESGLLVLPAPVEPMFADQVTGEQMARLIEVVRTLAGHVIVDLPAVFSDVVLSIIEVSDDIALVAGLDIPNIKNVKIGLRTLSMLGVPPEKLHLVLNRADSKVKLDVTEVEKTLRVTATAHVPSDIVVPISVNKGSPVVMSASKSAVARAFEHLALRFLEQAEVGSGSAHRRKFFG